jgi:hypothetical protein
MRDTSVIAIVTAAPVDMANQLFDSNVKSSLTLKTKNPPVATQRNPRVVLTEESVQITTSTVLLLKKINSRRSALLFKMEVTPVPTNTAVFTEEVKNPDTFSVYVNAAPTAIGFDAISSS